MSECLVLGGNGFLGSHVADALVDAGHNVTVFDRFSGGSNNLAADTRTKVRTIQGDFLNREDIAQAVNGAEYVFHFITTTQPITSENDPLVDVDTNVRGSVMLFEECATAGVRKVIFASTGGAMYGDTNAERLDESALPRPVSPYAIGKQAIEGYLHYFARKRGLDSVSYRISNPYGTRQSLRARQGVIPIFLQHIARGEPVTVMGDGSMIRDYIHVRDMAAMIVRSFATARQDLYNLGSGQGVSVNQLVETMRGVVGRPVHIEHVPTPSTFVQQVVLDTTRFTDEFGITPQVGLEEGVRDTWQYILERADQDHAA